MAAREQQITLNNGIQITMINDVITIDYLSGIKVEHDPDINRITLSREYHAVVENLNLEEEEDQGEVEPTQEVTKPKRTRKANG